MDLSSLSDLSRVGARAGITTGATLSGPSLASWFLERKLGEGYKDTLDQSDWCLMLLCNQAWISLLRLPEPRAKRKTVLKVKCFSEASFKGSKGALVSWCRARERFQLGMPLLPLGLSLWKLSRRQVRFSSLLTLMGELPNLSAMANLYPSWCLAATSCPETNTRGSQLWISRGGALKSI